jgi:glycosyltransferase involved in cell wall biosynthesis
LKISVVILSFNSEATIGNTLAAAAGVSDEIHVVDSFSTDRTKEICETYGALVTQRHFLSYADQRNWAIANLPLHHNWQLHLDADELLSPELIAEIGSLDENRLDGINGFFIPRLIRFLGRDLRHGGYYPIYHMRLFRSGFAHVEHRQYDQHFILHGNGRRLSNPFIDDHRMKLNEWVQRHNRWSDFEVDDLTLPLTGQTIAGNRKGDPIEQARARKDLYYHAPIFVRSLLLFLYRYLLRAGFLDGMPGLIYCVLQSFWFRFLVDAKLYERDAERMRAADGAAA